MTLSATRDERSYWSSPYETASQQVVSAILSCAILHLLKILSAVKIDNFSILHKQEIVGTSTVVLGFVNISKALLSKRY